MQLSNLVFTNLLLLTSGVLDFIYDDNLLTTILIKIKLFYSSLSHDCDVSEILYQNKTK